MIEIGNTLVSLDVFEKKFVCDLNACKGACCIKGDAGAPVEKEEEEEMKKVLSEVLPYMRTEGKQAVKEQGIAVRDEEGELTTPLVDGGECAYVTFDETGTAKCAFELAFQDGKIDFPKPVSCHLYPIRIRKYNRFEALNYDRWEICDPACALGEKLAVPVFRFVKNALVRKYGEDWFAQAEAAEALLQQERRKK
jgi:hypothetical protein